MAYKDRSRPKGPRKTSNVSAPNVKRMAKATKKAKRTPKEDFSQAAARIVKQATESEQD